jgi:hypothetical protein
VGYFGKGDAAISLSFVEQEIAQKGSFKDCRGILKCVGILFYSE